MISELFHKHHFSKYSTYSNDFYKHICDQLLNDKYEHQ